MKLESIPQSIQTPANWTAVGTSVGAFIGWIQGPLAVIASLLSILWLSLQIYSFFKKRKP